METADATGRELTIGALSRRTGVAASALRFYEAEGMIHSHRSGGRQRRYAREVLRRVSFIKVAQQVGLSLSEIRSALASLPDNRTPTERDWEELARSWRPRIDAQIRLLERLRDRLDGCIGCGCLSLTHCRLLNPGDRAGRRGPGPRHVIEDGTAPDGTAQDRTAQDGTAQDGGDEASGSPDRPTP
jgi:MerR family redox-sensitive transcriptional activator SoxR